MPPASVDTETVLVLTPGGRDAALTCELLGRDGLEAHECSDVAALCASMQQGAGAAMLAEEVLTPSAIALLVDVLAAQPPWSDFPLVIFSAASNTRARSAHDGVRKLGNVTFLDRPVHVRSMLAAVHAAIRGRRRQYAARRAIEARDEFLGMLGHELRNPLGAIRAAGELLARSSDHAQRTRHAAVIERQTRHLGRLVDDLLDVARVSLGKVTLQLEPCDICDVARSCFQTFEQAAQAQGLRYELRVCEPAAVVAGDRVRLDQILGNLLTNAIKYTPEGGTVRLEVDTDDARCNVRVIDSGIGVAPDKLDDIFDLFRQLDRGIDRAQGGIGLGLTLVRSLAVMHGGSVEAQSAGAGRGSTFYVRLPLLQGVRAALPVPASDPAAGAPRRIVIVEDNEDLRTVQAELLGAAGHDVQTACDGPDGVALILSVMPEVALVDLGLPGFDGFEVARKVRAAGGGSTLLIAVSGYGQAADRERAERAGFDAHLTKPVGLADLMRSIEQLGLREQRGQRHA